MHVYSSYINHHEILSSIRLKRPFNFTVYALQGQPNPPSSNIISKLRSKGSSDIDGCHLPPILRGARSDFFHSRLNPTANAVRLSMIISMPKKIDQGNLILRTINGNTSWRGNLEMLLFPGHAKTSIGIAERC